MEGNALIGIKIKTINNETFSYDLAADTLVSGLKQLILDSTSIDVARQRLIFRGRVLQNDLRLNDYSIGSGHVLHMVARPIGVNNVDDGESSIGDVSSGLPAAQEGSSSFHQLERLSQLHRLEENQQHYSSDISSYSFPLSSRFAVSGVANSNLGNPVAQTNESIISDSVERIRQGLLTMQTIISTMETVDFPTEPLIRDSAAAAVDSLNYDVDLKSNDYFADTNFKPGNSSSCNRDIVGLKSVSTKQQSEHEKDESSLDSFSEKCISTNDNDSYARAGKAEQYSKQIKQSPSRLPRRTAACSKFVNNFETTTKYSTVSKSDIPVNDDYVEGVFGMKESAAVFGNVNEKQNKKEVQTSPGHSVKKRELKVRKFFVGQWIDVKDTVAQWLEASVLEVDQQRERMFVHYNGWPARWDEWLPFLSPRIAPFRTRTLHAAQPLYISPSLTARAAAIRTVLPDPFFNSMLNNDSYDVLNRTSCNVSRNSHERNGDHVVITTNPVRSLDERDVISDPDDIRCLLPTIAQMMRSLQPLVDAAANIAIQSKSEEGPDEDCKSEKHSSESEGDTDRKKSIDAEFRQIAEELCPLVDRFGRVLTDLSPLLRTLASSFPTPQSNSSNTLSSVLNVRNLPMDHFPAPEHPSNNVLEMSLASLLRPRAPSPSPLRAFRQPISTSAQAPIGLGLGLRANVLSPGAAADALGIRNLDVGGGNHGHTALVGLGSGGVFDIHFLLASALRNEGSAMSTAPINDVTLGSRSTSVMNSLSPHHPPHQAVGTNLNPSTSGTDASWRALTRNSFSSANPSPSAPEETVLNASRSVSDNVNVARTAALGEVNLNSDSSSINQRLLSPPSLSSFATSTSTSLNSDASQLPPLPPSLPMVGTDTTASSLSAPLILSSHDNSTNNRDNDSNDNHSSSNIARSTEEPVASTDGSNNHSGSSNLARTAGVGGPVASTALASWFDARREERQMEAEIDRLRGQLRQREQEYEEIMRAMLNQDVAANISSFNATTGSASGSSVSREESTGATGVETTGIELAGVRSGRAEEANSPTDYEIITPSSRNNLDNENYGSSNIMNSTYDSSISAGGNNAPIPFHAHVTISSSSTLPLQSEATSLPLPSNAFNLPLIEALLNNTSPVDVSISSDDEGDTLVTARGSGSESDTVGTDISMNTTNIATDNASGSASSGSEGEGEDDRMTASITNYEGDREEDITVDSVLETQLTNSTSSSSSSLIERVRTTRSLSSFDTHRSSDSSRSRPLRSTEQGSFRLFPDVPRSSSGINRPRLSSSIIGESGSAKDTDYADYDFEREDLESLSSGSISGDAIDKYVADNGWPKIQKLIEDNTNEEIDIGKKTASNIIHYSGSYAKIDDKGDSGNDEVSTIENTYKSSIPFSSSLDFSPPNPDPSSTSSTSSSAPQTSTSTSPLDLISPQVLKYDEICNTTEPVLYTVKQDSGNKILGSKPESGNFANSPIPLSSLSTPPSSHNPHLSLPLPNSSNQGGNSTRSSLFQRIRTTFSFGSKSKTSL